MKTIDCPHMSGDSVCTICQRLADVEAELVVQKAVNERIQRMFDLYRRREIRHMEVKEAPDVWREEIERAENGTITY